MSGSFQPLFGKLYSILPAKALVLASLLLFLAGTLLTALAPSSPVFILGRAISGCATAGITSGAFASKYTGIAAAAEAAASLGAPLVGGALVDRLSWRWCFFIEMLLVGLASVILALFLKTSKPKGTHEDALVLEFASAVKEISHRIDVVGTALFVPAFTLLILALQWGGSVHEWSDWRVLLPLAVSVVLLCTFALVQRGAGDRATLPPRIALRRNILFGFLFASCNNGALSVIEYYMPTYVQTVCGLSATTSGIMVLPTGAGLIVSVALAGFMTSYFGYYNPFMIMTGLLLPTATGLLTTVGTGTRTWRLILFQALLGFGSGIGFQGPQVAAQAVLSDADSQIGIAVMQLAQALGPAVGAAAAQSIFASGLQGSDDRTAYDGLSRRVHSMTAGGAEGGSKAETPSDDVDPESQSSGWTDLWESDQSDLWDRGQPSAPLVEWIVANGDTLRWEDRHRPRALVPGCGKGYDVAMLALHGLDVVGLEISEKGAEVARAYAETELADPHDYNFGGAESITLGGAGEAQVIAGDFFKRDWEAGASVGDGFDLIYDYTFLCALHPNMRKDWARRMEELLSPSGILVCLEFPLFKEPSEPGPPWPLKGVYWNLLAGGGNGLVCDGTEGTDTRKGFFVLDERYKPSRSYTQGRDTDMISVWRLKSGRQAKGI
ncbi:uncharacterized protein DNG_05109 [Cephalotrichum gorgonifer]|uniref:Uncharacterized protein n=1 Tax=Cephalotrichum gorgonifer TaxID=2041049 RepID=A0AAE8MX87_9PEZI|nr:uncharacterized protein DNG_05109 [Cephalotrichum gorgonifer]